MGLSPLAAETEVAPHIGVSALVGDVLLVCPQLFFLDAVAALGRDARWAEHGSHHPLLPAQSLVIFRPMPHGQHPCRGFVDLPPWRGRREGRL